MTGTDAPISVFLVDDHRLVRAGVSAYLAVVDDIELVGEAADGHEALARLAARADRLPDVVLMDITMPGMDGVTATREIRQRWPGVEVIAVTSFVEESLIRGALEAGAVGYLLKDTDPDDLAAAIRAAVDGRTHLDPVVARILAESVRAPRDPVGHLTPREREVLALVGRGAGNRDIARQLAIGERTARTHVSAILTKLGLASRTQAALWAVRHGLVADGD